MNTQNELWQIQTTRPGNKRETLHVHGRVNMQVVVKRVTVGLGAVYDDWAAAEAVTVKRL